MEQSTAIAPPMTFGQRLRFARNRLRLSLRDVEARLDHEVSASALAKWERDESDPGVRRLVAVAELYEVDPMWLIEGVTQSGQHHRRNDHWSTDDASTVRERHAAWREAGQLTLLQPVAA